MFRLLDKILFVIKSKLKSNSKVSLSCYIKKPVNIRMGRGVKVLSNSSIDASSTGMVIIGDNVTLNRYAYINGSRGGVKIGGGTEINNFSVITGTGEVEIGENVLIGPNVHIISYQHSFKDREQLIKKQEWIYGKVTIEDDVWIGASAVILAGVIIGKGSVVGAGSVVTKSCGPYSVLAGVPARIISTR